MDLSLIACWPARVRLPSIFQARRTSVAEVHGAGHDHVVGDYGFLGRLAVWPRSAGRAQKGKENE